jgi:hypothetical protein
MTKYLKGECVHCGGHLEFPAEAAGLTADCPHCGKQTDLLLAAPKTSSGIPTRIIIWTAITVAILLVALCVALWQLKRVERWAEAKKKAAAAAEMQAHPSPAPAPAEPPPEDPVLKAQFRVSEVKLEKASGTSLVHAVGTLENLSSKPRYGVTLQFELFDAGGKKVGTTSDYQNTIEPKAKWTFQAPVVSGKVTSAKVVGVTEQQ